MASPQTPPMLDKLIPIHWQVTSKSRAYRIFHVARYMQSNLRNTFFQIAGNNIKASHSIGTLFKNR